MLHLGHLRTPNPWLAGERRQKMSGALTLKGYGVILTFVGAFGGAVVVDEPNS